MTSTSDSAASVELTGATMPWAEARAEHLTGVTCLWQDLDGLHVDEAPLVAPLASILWGWAVDGAMVRVRLDGDSASVASCPSAASGSAVLPWAAADGRVRAARFAEQGGARLDLRLEQVVVDGAASGVGPVTFLRPAR